MELGKTGFPFSVSQPLAFGPDICLLWEIVLCLVGCLAETLTSTYRVPVVPAEKYLQILSNGSLGTKLSPFFPTLENHCS